MQSPKISIIMPVKNREDTLENAILSVINQKYDNLELLILDGASTDGTVDIIKRYEKHITYWHSKKDGNPTIAVNDGIQRATGDIIGLLMADDQYEPGLFDALAQSYRASPNADMFTCGGRLVRHNKQTNEQEVLIRFETQESLALTLSNVCFASSAICCRFIKKSFYQRLGMYPTTDENGKHIFSNDKIFLLDAILANVQDVFVPMVGYQYLSHAESSTFSGNRKNVMRLCEEHMMTADHFLKTKPLTLRQRFLFMYWYNDQSARLFVYQCLQRDFCAAFYNFFTATVRYNLLWPISFIVTSIRVVVKKLSKLAIISRGDVN